MGLDGVEIIMRTEETFGIEIPDEIAQGILSPAALVDFVAAQVPLKPTDVCLSQQLFYRLRRGFRSQLKALTPIRSGCTPQKHSAQGSMAAGLAGGSNRSRSTRVAPFRSLAESIERRT